MDINIISSTLIANAMPIITVFIVLIHIFCGLAIAKDIPRVLTKRITMILLPQYIWILVGLIMGIWGLFIYWIMHHTNISRD